MRGGSLWFSFEMGETGGLRVRMIYACTIPLSVVLGMLLLLVDLVISMSFGMYLQSLNKDEAICKFLFSCLWWSVFAITQRFFHTEEAYNRLIGIGSVQTSGYILPNLVIV